MVRAFCVSNTSKMDFIFFFLSEERCDSVMSSSRHVGLVVVGGAPVPQYTLISCAKLLMVVDNVATSEGRCDNKRHEVKPAECSDDGRPHLALARATCGLRRHGLSRWSSPEVWPTSRFACVG